MSITSNCFKDNNDLYINLNFQNDIYDHKSGSEFVFIVDESDYVNYIPQNEDEKFFKNNGTYYLPSLIMRHFRQEYNCKII